LIAANAVIVASCLMINVDDADAARLSAYKKYERMFFSKFMAIINKMHCHFLHENKCTVYEARPTECRKFPGFRNAGFTKRLFAIFMHYERCPIIYNVVEKLKKEVMKPQLKWE
jgi:Fe-S-cluster containining protein